MIAVARRFQIGEQLRCQMVRHGNGPERRAGPDRQLTAIAQHPVQLDLRQIARGVDDARDAEPVEVACPVAQQRELLIGAERAHYRTVHDFLSRFEQQAGGMAAGIANDIALLVRICNRFIRDAGHRERAGVDPQRMLRGVVHDDRPIAHGLIEQRAGRGGRGFRAEIAAPDQDAAVGMAGSVGTHGRDERIRLRRRDAVLRRGQIETGDLQRTEQQVHMRVHDAWNDRAAFQIHLARSPVPASGQGPVGPGLLDARAVDGDCLRPRLRRIARVDVPVHQQQSGFRHGPGRPAQHRKTNQHPQSRSSPHFSSRR